MHIPAGIANGQSVRLKGKGQKGYNGKDGDLLIKVKVGENLVTSEKARMFIRR